MASVSIRKLGVAFGNLKVLEDLDLEVEARRVHRPPRRIGLRQVHAAERHRRPARHRGRPDLDRRQERHLGGAGRSRHRHGVPVLRALSAHDGGGKPHLRAEDRARAARRDREAGEIRLRAFADRAAPEAPPGAALRRSAPARRDRPRAGARRRRLPLRRAALQSRRQAPHRAARRAEAAAPAARQGDDDLRHARPDRGADARRSDRRHACRRHPAARHPAQRLSPARQPLRRRVRRLADDEFPHRANFRFRRTGVRSRRGSGFRFPAILGSTARRTARRWSLGCVPSTSPSIATSTTGTRRR